MGAGGYLLAAKSAAATIATLTAENQALMAAARVTVGGAAAGSFMPMLLLAGIPLALKAFM